jgi:hypothetical protein
MLGPTGQWRKRFIGIVVINAISLANAAAEENNSAACSEKDQYTLLNPTPADCMREFEPDRPDLTDNPFTVDAGHVQLEADLVNYALSRPDSEGTVTEKFLFGATDIRVGLTNNIEIDALVQPINALRTRFAHPPRTDWAIGPDTMEIGSKFNLDGNDTYEKPGSVAFGIRPFIEIPTVHNGVGEEHVEGGVSGMLAVKLSEKAELELMTEYDISKNEESSGYHVEYFNSGSFSYEWTSKISTYLEVATLLGNEEGAIILLGTGILYQPRENIQIDFGSNFGVTQASDRINPFIGITKRF